MRAQGGQNPVGSVEQRPLPEADIAVAKGGAAEQLFISKRQLVGDVVFGELAAQLQPPSSERDLYIFDGRPGQAPWLSCQAQNGYERLPVS